MSVKSFATMFITLILTTALMVSCSKSETKNKAYYFKMGRQYFNQGQFENAAESFKRVIEDFEGNAYRAESLFFMGYIYANELKEMPDAMELASKYYNQLIEEFPNHELTDDAKVEIANLGKDPEDIIFPMQTDSTK